MKICILTTPIRPVPTNWPPLGSMAIIQSLRNDGHDVHFYNIDFHRPTHQQNLDYFNNNKFDAIGISAVVSTAYAYTKYISKLIRSSNQILLFFGWWDGSKLKRFIKENRSSVLCGRGWRIIVKFN